MISIHAILAWISVNVYQIFTTHMSYTTTGVVDQYAVPGFDPTFLYKQWDEFWSLLQISSSCSLKCPGTGIASPLTRSLEYAILPRQNLYGLVPRSPSATPPSMAILYVYLLVLFAAMIGVCCVPRGSSTTCGPKKQHTRSRRVLDLFNITWETTISSFLPASLEATFREALISDTLKRLLPCAASLLPQKTATTHYPISVFLIGVIVIVFRFYTKSLHDKIILRDQRIRLLEYQLDRKTRGEARRARRHRTKHSVPRTSSCIETEIISPGATALHWDAIKDRTCCTPWNAVSYFQFFSALAYLVPFGSRTIALSDHASDLRLIARESMTNSRINPIERLCAALMWGTVMTDRRDTQFPTKWQFVWTVDITSQDGQSQAMLAWYNTFNLRKSDQGRSAANQTIPTLPEPTVNHSVPKLPLVAPLESKTPVNAKDRLAAWGAFSLTDRQRQEEEQQRFKALQAAREAEQARTGVRHEPEQPKFTETWKQVKIGHDNVRRVLAVQKDPTKSGSSGSVEVKGKESTPPTRMPPADMDHAPKSSAQDPHKPAQNPLPARETPPEIPKTVRPGTQYSDPSTPLAQSKLPVQSASPRTPTPFEYHGINRKPVCVDFLRGHCSSGNKCSKSHDLAGYHPSQFNKYGHLPSPRVTIPKSNEVCRKFIYGHCSKGEKCRYQHPRQPTDHNRDRSRKV